MTPSIDKKAFGQFIGRNRERRGLTQGAMAEAAGISRPYLAQIEGGTRIPSDDVVQRLITLSGASYQQFIDEVVGVALTPDQKDAIGQLIAPWDAVAQQISPEQMLELSQQLLSIEQMAEAMGKLSTGDLQQQIGPEGWAELGKEDRRLVQRIINRLRAKATPGDEEEGE